MEIESCIKENKIIVFVVPVEKYSDMINEIASSVMKVNTNAAYVTLNKPYSLLSAAFEKKGVDIKNIVFIDSVCGGVRKPDGCNVSFVSSPKALTELSIAINENMTKENDILIFDSLSTLLVYEDQATVLKFFHALISKMRSTEKSCVIVSLSGDVEKNVLKDIGMFVDKVVDLN